jgi:uncharacterized iron-regulated membrane protein
MKRLLFQIHRWAGIVLALFMVLWFFSGLVIVYSGYSYTTRAQQQARAEVLLPESGWLSLGEAWERSAAQRKDADRPKKASGKSGQNVGEGIGEARLVRQAGRPLWLAEDNRGRRFAISATDGSLHRTTPDEALKIASVWANQGQSEPLQVRYLETADKFTILRNQETLSPFHRIAIDDGADSELYISARSGEVLHVSTRVDRAFYWAGNWLHMFRPLDSVGLGDYRRDTLLWIAFAAVVASLAGLIIGWLRWRPAWGGRPTYSEGRTQPYRQFWSRWHFWSGLLGGTAVLLWATSGYLTNNPWEVFSQANASREELSRYLGAGVPAAMRDWRPSFIAENAQDVVELDWRHLGDEAVLSAITRDGRHQALTATSSRFSDNALLAAVKRVSGDVPVAAKTLQEDYDSYYYPSHRRGTAERPLPVLRVELGDAAGTRFYLDPRDGGLVLKQDQSRRALRWLFSAVHHWDFGWLYQRPLWDGWMLLWISFGLVLSVSSVVIGWRRLQATFKPKKRGKRQAAAASELATESTS